MEVLARWLAVGINLHLGEMTKRRAGRRRIPPSRQAQSSPTHKEEMKRAKIVSWLRSIAENMRAWWDGRNARQRWLLIGGGGAAAALVIAGAVVLGGSRSTTTQAAVLQTTVVRSGDLVLSATGTGTLTAPEKGLGFAGSGDMTVTAVNVKAGDLVQEGRCWRRWTAAQAQKVYDEAQRAYAELTSISAQAAALRKVADAQTQVQRAKGTLEYLISPEVLSWETQIAQGEQKLKTAKAAVERDASDATAKAAVDKETAFLDFAQDKLAEAWKTYYQDYVPATFGIKEDLDVDTYNVPSDLEIKKARLAVTDAEQALAESQELFEALKSGVMPEDTTNESAAAGETAAEQLKNAKADLEGSRIVAPFTGTVMEVNIAGGDVVSAEGTGSSSASSAASSVVAGDGFLLVLNNETSNTSSSSSDTTLSAAGVIVLADTSQPYLEVNWSESDWPLLKLGNEVQITFDDRQDKMFSGRITEIDRQLYASSGSSTIRGEVSLDGSLADLGLPVGASASVEAIAERADNAILIPVEALHTTNSGQSMVFVVENNAVRLRQVEVGLKGDTYAAITSGLQVGEVVTTGTVATQ